MSRRQLAVVDDTSTAVIYDVFSNRETYRDSNVSSVAFNSVYEDMLCYSGQNTLSIRTADFEPHRLGGWRLAVGGWRLGFWGWGLGVGVLSGCCREKLVGFVVGVKGSKVFCLQSDSMKTVDVPQSASMHKCVDDWVVEDVGMCDDCVEMCNWVDDWGVEDVGMCDACLQVLHV